MAVIGCVLCGLVACQEDGGATVLEPGGERDDRYLLELSVTTPPDSQQERLQLRVRPRSGWKVAPEAPVRLALQAPDGVRFEPSELASEQAERLDREGIELRSAVSVTANRPTETTGQLRFGICEGEDGLCQIVRRELRFRVPAPSPAEAP